MTENEVRSIIGDWVEASNSNDMDAFRHLYAQDVVLYQAPVKSSLTGIDHVIARLEALAEMSPDARMTVRDLHVVGDTAILEFNYAGPHTGRFLD